MKFGTETETLEFKKSTSELKEAIISIVSMLNKHTRGELYFGIKNDGKVEGQDVSEKTLRDISQSIQNHIEPQIYPKINMVSIEDKNCIHIVFEGENIPYYAYGRAYIRIADEDKVMSPSELEKYIIHKKSNDFNWDSQISDKDINDISEEDLKEYLERANTSRRVEFTYSNKIDVLNKLGLIKNDILTNTAKVMFDKESNLEIQMAIFATEERLTFNDIKRERGTVPQLVEIAEKYIRNNIKWRVEFDGSIQRKEIPEIPLDAIREALVNSFCHKDYTISQNNEVAIFKNRIEIYNPGTFPMGLTPEDFITGSERSIKRNPLLSQILYYSKDVESFGTGIRRIVTTCEKSKVKVEFKLLKAGFEVIFYRPKAKEFENIKNDEKKPTVKTDDKKATIKSDDKKRLIIEYLKTNETAKNKEFRNLLNVKSTRVKEILHEMISEGIIETIGANKNRAYKLKK